jgi:flagellar motor component MotA
MGKNLSFTSSMMSGITVQMVSQISEIIIIIVAIIGLNRTGSG